MEKNIYVYYENIIEKYIDKMPIDNEFIKFIEYNENISDEQGIYIVLNDKKFNFKKVIKICEEKFPDYENTNFKLDYNLQYVYTYFYDIFVEDDELRNKMLIYNIYHKILCLIDRELYTIKYPINFDPIETFLIVSMTNKSFCRIGDGQQSLALNRNHKFMGKIYFPDICYEITLKMLNKNYDYDQDKLIMCHNDIFYKGIFNFHPKHRRYWGLNESTGQIGGFYCKNQMKIQNYKNIYYSSHSFRFNSTYYSLNLNNIGKLLKKIYEGKNIVIVSPNSIKKKFKEAKNIIEIMFEELKLFTDDVINYIIKELDEIINKTQDIVIFVQGTIVSGIIVDKYYKLCRVCDIGSFCI